MKNNKQIVKQNTFTEFLLYTTPSGKVSVEIFLRDENLWLTQKKMTELFDTTPQNITQHLKNIYTDGEADQTATCKDFLQVQKEGVREVKRNTSLYSLEAIIAVNSERGAQFRQWREKKTSGEKMTESIGVMNYEIIGS